MNNRFLILIATFLVLITCGVVFAQPVNELRPVTNNPISSPTPASPQGVVKLSAQLLEGSHSDSLGSLLSQDRILVQVKKGTRVQNETLPEMSPEVRAAAFPNEGSTNRNAQSKQPDAGRKNPPPAHIPTYIADKYVVPANHVESLTDTLTDSVAPIEKPKHDLGPITNMLDSLSNQPERDQATTPNRFPDLNTSADRDRGPNLFDRIQFEATPKESSTSALANPTAESIPSDQESSSAPKQLDREKLTALIKNLVMSTCFVLCFGVGFIFVAKQYMKGKEQGQSNRRKKSAEPAIEVKSSLRLSPKSNLHLVEAGDQRLIVAMDQAGIKSVVKLTDSFANTLESLEELAGHDLAGHDLAGHDLAGHDLAGHDLAGQDLAGQDLDEKSNDTVELGARDTPDAGMYSLAMLSQTLAKHSPAIETAQDAARVVEAKSPIKPKSKTEIPSENEVRRKMEAAMCDQGIKELVLETLRKSGK